MPTVQASSPPRYETLFLPHWDNPPPPPRTGLAVAYLSNADAASVARTSKLNRGRLEIQLSSRRNSELANDISNFGVKHAANESDLERLVAAIFMVDQPAAGLLWTMLEKRFIAMAENDISAVPELERIKILQRIIGLSNRNLPGASQGVVLAEIANLVTLYFSESSLALHAVDLLFESCKMLPLTHQVKGLSTMIMSVPFISDASTESHTAKLIKSLQNESRKMDPVNRGILDHELNQAREGVGNFVNALAEAITLPLAEQQARLKELIDQIEIAPHLHVEHMIRDVLNHFESQPQHLTANLLGRLTQKVGLIGNIVCRASRLQSMLPLVGRFDSSARGPALMCFADVALTLEEPDRKAAFIAMCIELAHLNLTDRSAVFDHVTPLAESLPIEVRADLLSQVPVSMQAAARAAARANSLDPQRATH